MSQEFNPSVGAAKKAVPHVAVEQRDYPAGVKGIEISLNEVAARMKKGRNDPRVRSWAIRTLKDAGEPQGIVPQTQALLNGLRKATMYVQDPINTEFMQAAHETLCLDDKGYCFKGGDCDDLAIALGSATLSVGIPTYVVGQAFGGAKVPTHVLIAVEDKMGTKHRVDPSSKFDVGGHFPASNEVWLNPFEDKPNLSGTSGTSDFVGVGATPISDATYAALSTQLQAVVKTLGNSLITLDSSLTQISATRKILRPNIPFDPEPTSFSIKSLADFPTGGVWTKSMDVISRQLYSIGRTVLDACQQALDGARTVYIDEKTLDAYIEAKERDDWRFQVVWEGAKDAIIGMFDPTGGLLAGFTTVLGAYLNPQEIKAQQSGQNQTGVQGPPDDATGLGAIQFEVIAGLAVAAVCTVAVAYAISKLCDRGASEAKEATNQSVLQFVTDCVQSGKCTAEQAKEILNAQAVMRKAEADADAAKAKHDPFQGTLDALGGVLKWVAIGGAVVGGIYFLGPLVRDAGEEAIAHHRIKKAPG